MKNEDFRDLERTFQKVFGPDSNLFRSINSTVQNIQKTVEETKTWTYNTTRTYTSRNHTHRPGRTYAPPPPPRPYPNQPAYSAPSKMPVPGRSAGTAMFVLGIVFGALLFPLWLMLQLAGFTMSASYNIIVASVFLPLMGCDLFLLLYGYRLRSRSRRFLRYQQLIRQNRFISINVLASATGRTPKFVLQDLRRMIRKGFFADAHIDEQETTLMLDRETYQQYLTAQQAMKQREAQQSAGKGADPRAGLTRLEATVAEGKEYLSKIQQANLAIPGEIISQKLYRLEAVTTKIFAYIQQHEEKIDDIRKFMRYYLPTTLKLVEAYQEFDAQPVQGSRITSIKQEIEDSLDTINSAFEKLLGSLFEDDAVDISTEISALETMLEQEGLTENEFSK